MIVHCNRLLVVVCENKLLLYDLNTRKPYEVPRTVLDNKTPTCVIFLFRGGQYAPGGQPDADNLMTSPVLAVGCSDGAVRLLHLATLRVSTQHMLRDQTQAPGTCSTVAHSETLKQLLTGPVCEHKSLSWPITAVTISCCRLSASWLAIIRPAYRAC